MAIVSAAFCRGQMLLLGVESHPVKGHEQIETLLMAHIKGLRKTWGERWIIFFAESNLGQEADHMCFMLRNMGFVHCVREEGIAGVRTTNKRKELYAMELSKFMSQGACVVHEQVVCENPFGDEDRSRRALDELRKQLTGFRKIVLQSTTGRSEARVCYTGKMQGANDDLVITLSICAYWGVQFLSKRVPSVPYDAIESI